MKQNRGSSVFWYLKNRFWYLMNSETGNSGQLARAEPHAHVVDTQMTVELHLIK